MSNKTQSSLDLAKHMFKHACAFYDCTFFCHTELHIDSEYYQATQTLGIPDIVISCFACEVYIKSLLILYGMTIDAVKKMKHHIQCLWEKYEQFDPASAQDFLSSFVWCEKHSKQDFLDVIKIIDNNFQDVRYLYEEVGVKSDRTFLLYFCPALRNFCCMKIHGCNWNEFVKYGCKW